MRTRRRVLPLLLTSILAALALPLVTERAAFADDAGVQTLAVTQRGKGVSLATFGVGLSAVRDFTPAPKTTAPLDVTGLPAGAIINHAYLYWVTYGSSGAPTMTLDNQVLPGTLLGTVGTTCWTAFAGAHNYVYRSDITSIITGNAQHNLTGFPSAATGVDTQGAAIVIIYTDPAATYAGSVLLADGSILLSPGSIVSFTFDDVKPPKTTLAATMTLGVADGESYEADGALRFNDVGQTAPIGQTQGLKYSGALGPYWDNATWDVAALMPEAGKFVWWQQFSQDCLVFVYSALAFRAPLDELIEEGGDGGVDASSGGGGAGGTSGNPAGGGGTSGGNPDGGNNNNDTPTDGSDSDGCGCSTTTPFRHIPSAAITLSAIVFALRRLKRRR